MKGHKKQLIMPKWVSFLPILTVLETLTLQGFFIRAFGLSVRREQEVFLLRVVSSQCGWDGFCLLKNWDSADFPALFDHPHQWLSGYTFSLFTVRN